MNKVSQGSISIPDKQPSWS